jgi:hypothetical protein
MTSKEGLVPDPVEGSIVSYFDCFWIRSKGLRVRLRSRSVI